MNRIKKPAAAGFYSRAKARAEMVPGRGVEPLLPP